MNKKEKKILSFFTMFALVFGLVPVSNAMHIMEGYLPPKFCILWGVICIPFLVKGYITINKTLSENPKSITILAMSGAYIFVISALKIPSVTGSCSHMTGTGLAAILFGATSVSILGIIVLIFQALLLAHGGLTSLGANTFSMAIAGPLLSYAIFKICNKLKLSKHVSVFLASSIGSLFTYCITSIQLALAYPSTDGGFFVSAIKFLSIFATTQIPLSIIEGILTVVIIIGFETYAKSELLELGFLKRGEC